MPKRSSPYHQFGLETLLLLSIAFRFNNLKTKPIMQLRREIRSENQVLDSEENFWRLSVVRSTINPAIDLATVIEHVHVLLS